MKVEAFQSFFYTHRHRHIQSRCRHRVEDGDGYCKHCRLDASNQTHRHIHAVIADDGGGGGVAFL